MLGINAVFGLCSCKKKKHKDEGDTREWLKPRVQLRPEEFDSDQGKLIKLREWPNGREQDSPRETELQVKTSTSGEFRCSEEGPGEIKSAQSIRITQPPDETTHAGELQSAAQQPHPKEDTELNFLLEAIARTQIDQRLEEAEQFVTKMVPDPPFAKISSAQDPLELYFQVGDHPEHKEKFHKFLSSYTASFDPKTFVLRQCLLSEEDRLKSNTALQSYKVLLRRRIGDTYYMVNHAVFKKVLMFAEKDSLCVKAVRFLANGDCVEQNISFDHERVPITRERIQVLSNPIFYLKTEKGLSAKSFNFVLPKTTIGFTILKTIMNKSYNDTFKALLERVAAAEPRPVEDLVAEFKN